MLFLALRNIHQMEKAGNALFYTELREGTVTSRLGLRFVQCNIGCIC